MKRTISSGSKPKEQTEKWKRGHKVEKGSGLGLSLSRYKANEEKRGQRNIERKVRIQDLLPF
jgi:hypothetical protein